MSATYQPGDRVMWHRRSGDLSGRVSILAAEVIEVVTEPNAAVLGAVARVAIRHAGGIAIVDATELEPHLHLVKP